MHSSRIRTARFSGHLYVIFPGVSAWGCPGCVCPGGCLPGVSTGGVRGGVTDSLCVETID